MCVKHAIRGNDTQNYTCREMELFQGVCRKLQVPLKGRAVGRADSVPTQAHRDGNLSGLLSSPVCRTTTENLMLASYVPSVTRRLHKNPTLLLPVDCHRYRTEQTLPQAPSSSLGRPGDNFPAPKAKRQQDAEMPISHHATQPAQQPGTVLYDKRGSYCQHDAACKSLDLGFSRMDASTVLLTHTLWEEGTARSSRRH